MQHEETLFFRYSGVFLAGLVLALAAINALAGTGAALLGARQAAEENGLIENTQMALLLAAGLAFLVAALLSRRANRVVLSGGAALALLIANRELPSELFEPDHALQFLKSFRVRLIFWGAVAAGLLVWAFARRAEIGRLVRRIDRNAVTPPLLFAGLLIASYLFERAIKSGVTGEQAALFLFLEETLELNAYMVLCAAAVYFAYRARQIGCSHPTPAGEPPSPRPPVSTE